MKTTNILTTAIMAAAGLALCASSAQAQNLNYDRATDLVLFAQERGGSTLLLNIGTYASFRDATSNILNIKNINSELTTLSGSSSWYNDTNLWWGIAAAPNNSSSLTAQSNGDPRSTLYLSKGRTALGTVGTSSSSAPSFANTGDPVSVAGTAINVNNRLELASSNDRLVEGNSLSGVDEANPFLNASNPGTAYGFFGGGIMGTFGPSTLGTLGPVSNVESALDLYRLVRVNGLTGQVNTSTPALTGDFLGSFAINTSGDISFLDGVAAVPEPTTMGATLALACIAGSMRRRRRAVTA